MKSDFISFHESIINAYHDAIAWTPHKRWVHLFIAILLIQFELNFFCQNLIKANFQNFSVVPQSSNSLNKLTTFIHWN